jgi:two-component system, NarL family, sensor histidine kinase DevS
MSAQFTDDSRLEALIEAGIAIASGLELEVILSRLVELACDLTDAQYGALGVLDDTGNRLARFITHGINDETRAAIGPEPTGRGILGVLITDARPLRMSNIASDPRSVGFPPNHPPMQSFLGVPVMAGGSVFGNLYLTEKRDGDTFTEPDERVAVMLAAQAGVAIHNAHLFVRARDHATALERAVSELSSVHEINEAILTGQPLERVLRLICDQARIGVHARQVVAYVVDPDRQALRITAASGSGADEILGVTVPVAGSKVGAVMHARRSARLDDIRSDAGALASALGSAQPHSAAMAPMVYHNQAVGVLAAHDHLDRGIFNTEDTHLLELFSARATLALGMTRAMTGERERADAEVLLSRAEQLETARRDTLRRVVDAQERERRRIARELHDDTGQSLTSVLIGLRLAEESDDLDHVRVTLRELRETVTAAIRDLRALAVELRPTALDDFGLEPALERLVDTFGRRTGLAIEMHVSGLERRLGDQLETALYRIVQEALTNVAKHAGATQVSVVVRGHDQVVSVVVEDDGRGFEANGPALGLGLVSMRERAELLGGSLRVESAPGRGTTVAAEVPV